MTDKYLPILSSFIVLPFFLTFDPLELYLGVWLCVLKVISGDSWGVQVIRKTPRIDPIKEPELMWLAREGIVAPLPVEWKPW